VPATADVQVHATAGAGDVQLDGRTVQGPGARMDEQSLGTDGVASGRPLVLDVSTGAGDVTVRHD
jgi:predicted membrane protein